MPDEVLTRRALNRALLSRQMLLQRKALSPTAVIDHLGGLQAQQARPPFVGLWTRISGFQREDLRALVEARELVRATWLRHTLHLLSRSEYLRFRALLQPMLTGAMNAVLRERTATFDMDAVLAEARRLFAEGPRTFTEIREGLVRAFPQGDERAMGYAVRTHLPLAIAPEEHPWSYRADPGFTLAEEWLGEPLRGNATLPELALRYLGAFGPATVGDMQAWSGFSRLAPVFAELRPQLVTFRDERKRELFDLPDAPRPPEEMPVPVRVAEDQIIEVRDEAGRNRVIADAHRPVVVTKNGLVLPTILVDGVVAGTWKAARVRKTAVVTVTPFATLSAAAKAELAAEAEPLARFVEPEAAQFDLRFEE